MKRSRWLAPAAAATLVVLLAGCTGGTGADAGSGAGDHGDHDHGDHGHGDHDHHHGDQGSGNQPLTGQEDVLIIVIGGNPNEFAFEPARLEVSAGQRVGIEFSNDGSIDHEFAIKDLDFHLYAGPGESASAAFHAPGPGEYTIGCHIPGHFESGMRGTLVVSCGPPSCAPVRPRSPRPAARLASGPATRTPYPPPGRPDAHRDGGKVQERRPVLHGYPSITGAPARSLPLPWNTPAGL